MSATPPPMPTRMKGLNRAEICDRNFSEFVENWSGAVAPMSRDDAPVLPGSACTAADFRALFESQLISRHLDLMARSVERRVGKSVSVRVDLGGRRIIKIKQTHQKHQINSIL